MKRHALNRFVLCLLAAAICSGPTGSAQQSAPFWTEVPRPVTGGSEQIVALDNGGVAIVGNLGAAFFHPEGYPDWAPDGYWLDSWSYLRYSNSTWVPTNLNGGSVMAIGGMGFDGHTWTATDVVRLLNGAGEEYYGSLQTARARAQAVVLSDGRILVVGGETMTQDLKSAEIMDPAVSGGWSFVAPTAAVHKNGTIQLLHDGRVFVIGGGAANPEIFDAATNTWTMGAPIPLLAFELASALLPDGRVMVVGGLNLSAPSPLNGYVWSQVYDPVSNTWALPTPIEGLGPNKPQVAVRANGKILAAGQSAIAATAPAASMYDPGSQTWSTFPVPRAFANWITFAAPLIGNRTMVVDAGGEAQILSADTVTPPVADAGPDQTLAGCAGCLVPVTLDASASADADGDLKNYVWKEGETVLASTWHPSTTAAIQLSVGVHAIELTLSDWNHGVSTDTVIITVNDSVADLSSQLAQCQADASTIANQVAALQSQISALQGELSGANTLNAQLNAQIVSLQSDIQARIATIASLTAQIGALQAALAGDANTIAALNAQIVDLGNQNAALAAQVSALTAQIAPLQASVNQLVAPGPQIASAIVAIGALIPTAPTGTARTRLESARTALIKSGINIAASDLIMGLNQTKSAVSLLASAPLAGMNTAPIRQSLSGGVRTRLLRATADVTALVGSSQANVVAANGFLAAGDAAQSSGDYVTAIEQYVLAFKQLQQI